MDVYAKKEWGMLNTNLLKRHLLCIVVEQWHAWFLYTYLGVTFTRPRFSLRQAACIRISHGYAALGALERQYAHLQFQEPRTKLWLFDTLVTPTLLYGV